MGEVRLTVEGAVATLTLAAPQRRNALTEAMAAEILDACKRIDADPRVGAVVVCADGPTFCAGAHLDLLRRVAADPAAEEGYEQLMAVYEAFTRIGRLEPPTVAAIRGAAVGAGTNLALATDLRIVAEDARLSAGFLRLGLHPGGGHFTLVGRLGGRELAAAVGVFGEEIDGRRAAACGLAWEAVPADQVEPRAHELAARAAANVKLARRAVQTMRRQLGPPPVPWPVAVDAETSGQLWSLRQAASGDGPLANPRSGK